MTNLRKFPIRLDDRVTSIPWDMIAAHEAQARQNHGLYIEELAARGGLTPEEAVAILEDRPFERMPLTASTLRLKALVDEWTNPAPVVATRVAGGIALLERLRDGKAVPHRGHYNELIAILQSVTNTQVQGDGA